MRPAMSLLRQQWIVLRVEIHAADRKRNSQRRNWRSRIQIRVFILTPHPNLFAHYGGHARVVILLRLLLSLKDRRRGGAGKGVIVFVFLCAAADRHNRLPSLKY